MARPEQRLGLLSWGLLAKCFLGSGLLLTPLASANVLQEGGERFSPVRSSGGMVASQEAEASRVGRDILRRGGNAVDAAVATSFALAVTLPQAGNIGGGGFLVLWRPDTATAGAPLLEGEDAGGTGAGG